MYSCKSIRLIYHSFTFCVISTMKKYISILRGINVSGSKMVKMEALRKMYEDLKFKNVKTYIQSGNVLFEDKPTDPKTLEKRISKKIQEEFEFDVPVLVKEKSELETVLKNNPFVNKRKQDITKLHVTFLSEEPNKALIEKIKEKTYDRDEYIITGTTIYLFCPDGYGRTKLNNNFFENKLKVSATTRNWKTVNELVSMANA
jgi:uncharacterized protein (DUF1697 family)